MIGDSGDCPHILIVDDDPEIRTLLARFLTSEGLRVTTVNDGPCQHKILETEMADLVVLDLMLPGEDGLSLCRHLRATTALPVIMLTAAGSEMDRVTGLETGADDYLSKPFGTRELLARIRAVLRRVGHRGVPTAPVAGAVPCEVLEFLGWRLETARRQLMSPDNVLVDLTSGEYDLLLAFLCHPHRILSRDSLLDLSRGRVAGPHDRTIDVQVGRLRRKLEADPKNPEVILTVRGGGYLLTCDVVVKTGEPASKIK